MLCGKTAKAKTLWIINVVRLVRESVVPAVGGV